MTRKWVVKVMEYAENKYKQKDQYFCKRELQTVFGTIQANYNSGVNQCVENGGLIETSLKNACSFSQSKHSHYILNKKPDNYTFKPSEEEKQMLEGKTVESTLMEEEGKTKPTIVIRPEPKIIRTEPEQKKRDTNGLKFLKKFFRERPTKQYCMHTIMKETGYDKNQVSEWLWYMFSTKELKKTGLRRTCEEQPLMIHNFYQFNKVKVKKRYTHNIKIPEPVIDNNKIDMTIQSIPEPIQDNDLDQQLLDMAMSQMKVIQTLMKRKRQV
jgi:hypothetical protein